MSSKWKYADLPAQTRLDMLKNGNKDLFDEELARTKEVMDARREVGLDTDAQEKWIDNVGYNYNLHLAQNAGEDTSNVSRTGYADVYYTPKDRSSSGGKIKPNTGKSAIGVARENISNAAKSASEEIRKKYALLKQQTSEEFSEKSPIMREMLINSGASLDGGRAKQFFSDMQEKLASVYDEYDKAMNEELENVSRMYAQMSDKITEYRNNGVEEVSLLSIANNLIKGLQETGKVDYPKLDTLKIETPKTEKSESASYKDSDKDVQNKNNETVEEAPTQADDVYSEAENQELEKAKDEAIEAILDAMSDLTSEKIKNVFVKIGLTPENARAILERIKQGTAQKLNAK